MFPLINSIAPVAIEMAPLIAVHRHFLWRERHFLEPVDYLERLDDGELIQRFQLPSGMIEQLTREYVAAGYGNETTRSHAIPETIQVINQL